jgi:hypothetical protein
MTDELAHEPGPDSLWDESWYFDFADVDCELGGYVRLSTYPNHQKSWFWLALVGRWPGQARPVHFFDWSTSPTHGHESEITLVEPDGSCLLRCEAPFERWSVLAGSDDIELRLDWTCRAPAYRYTDATRYEQPAHVTGEVIIDGTRLTIDAPGQREHSWGIRDWWRIPWLWAAAHLDDGTDLHLSRLLPHRPFRSFGYVMSADGGLDHVDDCQVSAVPDAQGTPPERTELLIDHLRLTATALYFTSVPLRGPEGQVGTLARALCRFETVDGRAGPGWLEWNLPEKRTGALQ